MSQQTAARIAGFLYLLMMVTALSSELFARGSLLVANDALQTAKSIQASAHQFRLNIVLALLTAIGDVALLWALYVVLRPVNQELALLAAFWRIVECALFSVIAFGDFVALRFLGNAEYLRTFTNEQLAVLARVFLTAHHPAGQIAVAFLAFGSTLFAYLWWRSRYIPRPLAALGIAASIILGLAIFAFLVFPEWESPAAIIYWLPIALFEVTMGFWLLVKGVRV